MLLIQALACAEEVDLFPDTWAATESLGRKVSVYPEVPGPREDRTVGMFYFLWHGAHIQGGPYDISRILAADSDAMQKPNSPLWGPLHVPHHWGESIFGYYLTRDESVLRKHAQMLSDALIDVVIFDVTNQLTYREDYMALLRVWARLREFGNRTPQVAFLTPFWNPAKVTRELWRDLYKPGIYSDLWFRWEGKPLILADPELIYRHEENAQQDTPVPLLAGHTLGQSFSTERPFLSVAGRFPTWSTTGSSLTLRLRRGGPDGEPVAEQKFTQVEDNAWLRLKLTSEAHPGNYYLEAFNVEGKAGWWSHSQDKFARGEAFVDGRPVPGDRTLRLELADEDAAGIQEFFTFRKPQPDYFRGPTQPNMWSWLEVYPQHRFTNAAGGNEQMSVGVAQNAVKGRLGSMSEPDAHGRSFHGGATDRREGAVRLGLNVSEQWERALKEDPRFIFVTGWNEWIAGRFAEFNGVKRPVMFVDQFDQEHSRDIEPMRGGHGDDYYWQLVSFVRQFKGARPTREISAAAVRIDGEFADWQQVRPEFRDTIGDPVSRENRGWDERVTYLNKTGRNDIVAAKVSYDSQRIFFYARTREAITRPGGTNWMNLLIDLDADSSTGWMGYDFVVNRAKPGSVESCTSDFRQEVRGAAEWELSGTELELAIPWKTLGLNSPPNAILFKWADNCLEKKDWTDFTLNGDAAPNDRFNYRALFRPNAR